MHYSKLQSDADLILRKGPQGRFYGPAAETMGTVLWSGRFYGPCGVPATSVPAESIGTLPFMLHRDIIPSKKNGSRQLRWSR